MTIPCLKTSTVRISLTWTDIPSMFQMIIGADFSDNSEVSERKCTETILSEPSWQLAITLPCAREIAVRA